VRRKSAREKEAARAAERPDRAPRASLSMCGVPLAVATRREPHGTGSEPSHQRRVPEAGRGAAWTMKLPSKGTAARTMPRLARANDGSYNIKQAVPTDRWPHRVRGVTALRISWHRARAAAASQRLRSESRRLYSWDIPAIVLVPRPAARWGSGVRS
jgi:hypothetical protein